MIYKRVYYVYMIVMWLETKVLFKFVVVGVFVFVSFVMFGFVQVNKNAMLCKSVNELFQKGRDEVTPDALKSLSEKVRDS